MVLKKFRLTLIFQVVFLTLLIFLLSYLVLSTTLYASIFVVSIVIVVQIYVIINHVEKTNRHLRRFFEAIQHSDFSQSFSVKGLGSSFDELSDSFSGVIRAFQKSRSEKEENYRYLQTVVKHVGIGLLAFSKSGEIELINTAAKRLLGINHIKHLLSLKSSHPELVSKLLRLRGGEKTLIKMSDDNEIIQLAVYTTEFKLGGKHIMLVSLQNIQGELEDKEMEAWQNIIRVLTHEIMNSITPISSLAATVNDILANYLTQNDRNDTLDDVTSAVQTIRKRSEGLLHFVDNYRNLTRLPKPDFDIVRLSKCFEQVQSLMQNQLDNAGIKFKIEINPRSLEVTADPEMLEQILINLIMNAIQAPKNRPDPLIELTAALNTRGRVIIKITDNGAGIPEDIQENIFIPFYTTKKEGSGIGLSLCRQIMRAHRGTISVASVPEKKTVFTLRF